MNAKTPDETSREDRVEDRSPPLKSSPNHAKWSERYTSKRGGWWWWRLLRGSAPANNEEGDDDPTGPITVSPDPSEWRARRSIWPEGGWRRKRWDQIFVPADPPENFATESLADLVGKLKTSNEDVARAILAEAEAAYSAPQQVIDSAERRATTLQGTVAIAASVALAGGGLCSILLAFMAVAGASASSCCSPCSSCAYSAVLYARWARRSVSSTSRSLALCASPTVPQ
jgi:hypothetical protein